jgi:hypothetical protein
VIAKGGSSITPANSGPTQAPAATTTAFAPIRSIGELELSSVLTGKHPHYLDLGPNLSAMPRRRGHEHGDGSVGIDRAGLRMEQNPSLKSHPGPPLLSFIGRDPLVRDTLARQVRCHAINVPGRAEVHRTVHAQQAHARRALELVPELKGLAGELCVQRIVVATPNDARAAMRAAVSIAGSEALEQQHRALPPCERPRRRRAHQAAAHHDHIKLATHSLQVWRITGLRGWGPATQIRGGRQ